MITLKTDLQTPPLKDYELVTSNTHLDHKETQVCPVSSFGKVVIV